jgi:hypothetical protein
VKTHKKKTVSNDSNERVPKTSPKEVTLWMEFEKWTLARVMHNAHEPQFGPIQCKFFRGIAKQHVISKF